MVKQSFSIDFLLTGSKKDTLARSDAPTPHIPCVPQPQPPFKFTETSNQAKGEPELVETCGDSESFKNASDEQGTCLEYAETPTNVPCKVWMSADESTPNCSEDESEQVCSQSPERNQPEDDDHGEANLKSEMQRRMRTAFSSQQICKLEEMFKKHRYLGASERKKLASSLQLSEIQVKTWFQNRRMKLKRQMQDHQHRMTAPSVCYPHPVPYFHGPPVPVNYYQTQACSYPESSYTPNPRFLPTAVPPQAVMNHNYFKQYRRPFYNNLYM